MNQKITTPATTIASNVPRPTDRMLSADDISPPWMPCTSSMAGRELLEQRLPGELHRGVELVVGIGLLHEAVALVLGEDRPHRDAALLERRDDLLGLGVRHARIVETLDHHERLADLVRVVHRRDRFHEGPHLRLALVAVFGAAQVAA